MARRSPAGRALRPCSRGGEGKEGPEGGGSPRPPPAGRHHPEELWGGMGRLGRGCGVRVLRGAQRSGGPRGSPGSALEPLVSEQLGFFGVPRVRAASPVVLGAVRSLVSNAEPPERLKGSSGLSCSGK